MPTEADKWFRTVAVQDGVSFRTPGEVTRSDLEQNGQKLTRFLLDLPDEKMKFQVDVITLTTDVSKEAKTFFDEVKAVFLKNTGAELLDEDLELKPEFPEQLLLVQGKDGRVAARRSILDGQRVYSVQWTGPNFHDEMERHYAVPFVESVNLIDADGALRRGFETKETSPPPKASQPVPPAPLNPLTDDDLPAPPAPPM